MNDEALKDFKNHHMMIKNRESLDVTGIKKIECLNTNEFILETADEFIMFSWSASA